MMTEMTMSNTNGMGRPNTFPLVRLRSMVKFLPSLPNPFVVSLRDEARDAPIQEQAAQRNDEWLHAKSGNEEAMSPTQNHRHQDHEQHAQRPGPMPLGQGHHQEHPDEGNH